MESIVASKSSPLPCVAGDTQANVPILAGYRVAFLRVSLQADRLWYGWSVNAALSDLTPVS